MEQNFKQHMTFDEMAEALLQEKPWLVPNKVNVGQYAKRHGYKRVKQMVNKVIVMTYVKANN